jgi:hypothetical protein
MRTMAEYKAELGKRAAVPKPWKWKLKGPKEIGRLNQLLEKAAGGKL